MTEEMQPHEPVEGEYTDAELPLDAELPKDATRDWVDDDDDLDDVVVEEDVVVEKVDYVDPDETRGTPI